jgi:acyl-coenzyme A synthetase/AMP-(fatty) acid ligase
MCHCHTDNVAIILESGRQISYAELQEEISSFKLAFQEGGVVFCLCNNDWASLLCYLSALESNAVALLLPATIQEQQLQSLMAAYAPKYIFHNRTDFRCMDYGEPIFFFDDYKLLACVQPIPHDIDDSLALLLATSGSTGSPKLVRLSARNLAANADSIIEYLGITSTERAITSLPMHYSYGLSVINSHLRAGASIVLTDRSLMDAEYWRLIRCHEVTSFAGVPYTYEMLLKLKIERLKMPSVKTLTQAGGKLAPQKIQQAYASCTSKGIRFFTMYGQTEATARIAYLPFEDTLKKSASIGIPIPGGKLWIEDENANRILQPGTIGQLIYAGANVSLGYAMSYCDLSLGDVNHGVLQTGDLAMFDEDGYYYIVGRISRFVKIYGIRVSLDAVEKMLADMGIQSAVLGEDEHLLICLIGENQAELEYIRTKVSCTLSINKIAITVKKVKSLPRLSNGKEDYQKLTEYCMR